VNTAVIIAQLGLPLDRTKAYHTPLPPQLARWYCYPQDAGRSIVCVLKQHYRPDVGLTDYLIAVPVKTVMRGYEQLGEYVVVDVPYDSTLGLISPPDDTEY
jgi:hypothetical protein